MVLESGIEERSTLPQLGMKKGVSAGVGVEPNSDDS